MPNRAKVPIFRREIPEFFSFFRLPLADLPEHHHKSPQLAGEIIFAVVCKPPETSDRLQLSGPHGVLVLGLV
jgi:hypothetical protein